VGYAISINQIKNFMGYLRSGRIVDHATLGAVVSSDEVGGVMVTNILDTSDAYRRGLRYGDEIVMFGGRAISTVNGFKNALGIYPRGWRVPLSYRRDGERYDVTVRLAGVHSRQELIEKTQGGPRMPPIIPKPKKEKPGDKPKDGDPKPKPWEPEDGKPRKDGKPMPHRIPIERMMPGAKPMPEHVKKLYQEREGFANYYFNELNRDRVWQAFTGGADFTKLAGTWSIEGAFRGGGDVRLVIDEGKCEGEFDGVQVKLDPESDFSEQTEPAGSGGLMVALHLWHRLLTKGPEKYGEVYYLGTCPALGREGLMDVLVATHNVVESRFQFDPQSGQLVGMDLFSDEHVDPCEVFFDDYREVGPFSLPHRMTVLYGDEAYGVIELLKIELPEAAVEGA
jgi:hypothetical protein